MSRGMHGVFDNPRERRLIRDLKQMKQLRDESDILDFKVIGDPPEKYVITFKGKGLESAKKKRNTHKLEITLGPEYPRNFPNIRWTTPIYHPNISGHVCLGTFQMTPHVKLTDLVEILWDMTRMANWNPYSTLTSGEWQELNRDIGFPVDSRILRNLAPPAEAPPDDEGEMMILEGRGTRRPDWMKRPAGEGPHPAPPAPKGIFGAGLLIIREDGYVLLLRRSSIVSNPGTWAPAGGKVDRGEKYVDAAMREAEEEMGELPPVYLTGEAYVVLQGPLKFTTFSAFIPYDEADDWTPQLNEENDAWGWFSPYDLPDPLIRGGYDAIYGLVLQGRYS